MQNETFLCIAPQPWNSLWRSSHQIFSRIREQNIVLYFEPGRNTVRPVASEIIQNFKYFFKLNIKKKSDNLFLIPTPSSFPHARNYLPKSVLYFTMPLVVKINTIILLRHIQKVIKVWNIKNPVLWLTSPYHIGLLNRFDERLTCYFNYDEFPDIVSNKNIKKYLKLLDSKLSKKVDIVFATSQAQCLIRKKINPNTYFIPNGVDFNLFSTALKKELKIPDDISKIDRPIIGFAGWMAYQIDVNLLIKIAVAFPKYSLVLVGPEELPAGNSRDKLKSMPNVYFLGEKQKNLLPNYLKAFDVALLPYSLSGHVPSIYPLKVYEYLAAGKSVVSVDLPEIRNLNNVIRLAGNYEEFINKISYALKDNTSNAIEARVAVARKNTWDHRVKAIYSILNSFLSN